MTSTVLVVEDLKEVREWLSSLAARELGASRVLQAGSVAQAMACLTEHRPTLGFIDIGLPDGSGVDIIRAIKAHHPDCSCVVTTIFDDSDNLFGALRAGADGYLLKDEPEEVLLGHVRGILEGRPPLSAAIARKMLQAFRPVQEEAVSLTAREEQMLSLIARGFSVRNASEMLGISYNTGAGYLKLVYQKLQVTSRAEATLKAYDLGLISPAR